MNCFSGWKAVKPAMPLSGQDVSGQEPDDNKNCEHPRNHENDHLHELSFARGSWCKTESSGSQDKNIESDSQDFCFERVLTFACCAAESASEFARSPIASSRQPRWMTNRQRAGS